MPNTPKAEISACPPRAYARMACISAGELRVNDIFLWELRGERDKAEHFVAVVRPRKIHFLSKVVQAVFKQTEIW